MQISPLWMQAIPIQAVKPVLAGFMIKLIKNWYIITANCSNYHSSVQGLCAASKPPHHTGSPL
ncbi:hypothetical protein D7V96_24375 [bacterium D16-59]|nr:hypothetical protein D7V96_24375 [bacterium D16-59]